MSDNQYFSTTELRDSVYDFDAKVEANKIASNAERTIKNAKDPYYLIGIHFAREKHSKELVDGFLKSKFEQLQKKSKTENPQNIKFKNTQFKMNGNVFSYSDWVECCHNAILKKWEHDSETARRRGTLVHKVMALAVQDENQLLSKLIDDIVEDDDDKDFVRYCVGHFSIQLRTWQASGWHVVAVEQSVRVANNVGGTFPSS